MAEYTLNPGYLIGQILKAPGLDMQNRPCIVDVVLLEYLDNPETIKGANGKVTLDCIILAEGQQVKATSALLTP